MNLEQRVRRVIVRKTPSQEVIRKLRDGSKFIVVEDSFDLSQVPTGFTLIDVRYKGDSFRTLVPQSTLFYMADPGQGDAEEALDEVADFYDDVENFEDDLIEGGKTSVQGTNWATAARDAYRTYLINILVRPNGEDGDTPEFDDAVLKRLDLDDPLVRDRVKVMAALILGRPKDEISTYDVRDVLRHYSDSKNPTATGKSVEITKEEFKNITRRRLVSHWDAHTKTMRCLADSHYDLLPEYVNNRDWDYDLRTMTKTSKLVNWSAEISQIEEDIMKYRLEKHGSVGRHDAALIRQYANLAHIVRENPGAQLDIKPAAKEDKNGRSST